MLRARWAGWFGAGFARGDWRWFARQGEVGWWREMQHVAERAEHAAEAGMGGDQGDHIGFGEQMGELRAGAGDLVAGVEAQHPAIAGREFGGVGGGRGWFCGLGLWGVGPDAGFGRGWACEDLGEAAEQKAEAGIDRDVEQRVDPAMAEGADELAQECDDRSETLGGRAAPYVGLGQHLVSMT